MISLIKYLYDIIKDDNDKLNAIYYLWKRNNWMLDPRSYTGYFSKIPINSPIFLLGNQGDGLTLVSRIFRRHPQIISVTGNSKYWAGADEMMSVYEPILTPELSGTDLKAPYHKTLPAPRGWSYACKDLFNFYRKTEIDANERHKKKLKAAIGMAIAHYSRKSYNPRFIDKSQVFSVKMTFINKLLEDCNPYFIYITRNPFVTIYRAAIGKAKDIMRASKYLSYEERINICIEHWLNVAKSIEEDKNKVKNFLKIKFEDVLTEPKRIIKKICNFIDLKFYKNMLPKPNDKYPLGVRFKERWYPLRTDINRIYLKRIPKYLKNLIFDKCGTYIEKYGYESP